MSMLSEFIRTEKKETPELLVFDYPFGRRNKTLNPLIDIAVFLNVDVKQAHEISDWKWEFIGLWR